MNQGSSQASFNGVVSLRTREEVVALIEAVARVVHAGNIFESMRHDPQAWRPMLADIVVICNSAFTFQEVCLDPEGKERTGELAASMESSKRALGQLFLGLQGDRFPSAQEQQDIQVEMQNVLFKMAEVTDEMETDQVYRIKRAAKLAFEHVRALRTTTNNYRLEPKLADLRFAVDNLMQCLDNRLNILPDSPLKQDISYARSDIQHNLEPYIAASQIYIAHLTSQAQEEQAQALEPIVLGIKTIIDLIGDTLQKGQCSFRHEQILEDLDRLADAVRGGSAADAAGSARLLVEELNRMRDRATMDDEPDNSDLNDSCNRLAEMTQRLLAATRDALSTKSDQANETLASTVDDVKAEVAHVAQVEQAKNAKGSDLRMQLLRAAQNMSSGMGDFVATLNVE